MLLAPGSRLIKPGSVQHSGHLTTDYSIERQPSGIGNPYHYNKASGLMHRHRPNCRMDTRAYSFNIHLAILIFSESVNSV